MVSVVSGRVKVLAVVKEEARTPVIPVVLPEVVMLSFLVASVASTKLVVVVDSDLLVKVSVVALPTKVSVAAGSVSVPEAVAVAWTVVVPDVVPETM